MPQSTTFALATLGMVLLHAASSDAGAPALPTVAVTNVRRVPHNGEHNAFTDLCRFRQRYYLTFRSCPDGHMVHPTSSIKILASDDLATWQVVHSFQVAKRDTRDPHFAVFRNRLFVYTGTWYCGDTSPKTYDLNEHLGFAVWSEDGDAWSQPQMLEGTYGHYIWRAAAHGGKLYLCGRRKRHFVAQDARQDRSLIESAMLVSDDGLTFRTQGLFQTTWGDETAAWFQTDGGVLAVARRGTRPAQLLRSRPPYRDWQRLELDRYIGGPLLTEWGGQLIVGGRKTTGDHGPTTAFYWLVDDQLQECVELPSGGDNSYPGFVPLSASRGVVSWYSSHERDQQGKSITAVYLADLVKGE